MPSKRLDPELSELIRVVPIAQSQIQHGVTVMMLALELYTEGFVVTLRVLFDDLWPFGDNPEQFATLVVNLKVTTSSGTEWDSQMHHNVVSAAPKEGRFAFHLSPALDSITNWVRFEVRSVLWLKRIPDSPYRAVAQEIPGPWTFTMPLSV